MSQHPRNAYLHDVDLGTPLTPEEIGKLVTDNRHSPAMRAILQLVRNSAMQNASAAHDMVAAGRNDCGHLNLGAHQGLSELFWQLVGAIQAAEEGFEEEAKAE